MDDENLPLFTVGQVSDMLEIQQAFLRRLDEHGVVSPSRSEGRQRRYTRHEITVVRYVVDLVGEGMTLAAVRRVLELEDQVRALEAERDALREAVAQLGRPSRTWSGGGPPSGRNREPPKPAGPVGC